MSYCRFSDCDFQCDVYAYETEGGYQIHVAQYKVVYTEPLPEPLSMDDNDFSDEWFYTKYLPRKAIVDAIYERSDKVLIDLPYAGESFPEDSLQALLERLKSLREIGYRVPEYAIMTIENEIWENGDE